jgi:homoserine kinase type II
MERVIAAVPGLYATLPLQLIHGDFVTVNLLQNEDRITGVLDFEFTCRDLRPMDLASALPIPFNPGEPTDWDLIDALGRGYVSRQVLTLAEAEALPDVLRLRRAGTFVHMAGQYWAGKGREDLLHYGSSSAVHVEAWLQQNGAELVRRARAWAD